jgi:FecR protein
MTSRLLRSILLGLSTLLCVGAGPASADSSHARIVRVSLVQGDVRFARDVKGDPLTSDKAVWDAAVLNLPVRQGYVLATDKGRAQVEFENGALAFLSENTVLEFYDLSRNDDGTTTRLVLRQGTASFHVNPASEDYFSVTGGDFTVEAEGRSTFRLDNFDDGSVVNVAKGRVSVLRKGHTVEVASGLSFAIKADDNNPPNFAKLAEPDDFDRWVSDQIDSVSQATTATAQYTASPLYAAGFGSLYTYGSWFGCGGYGYGWRPFGVGYGWSPFTSGQWILDPFYGWTFVSFQPWGWAPYHYGGWLFDAGCGGWFYSPPVPYIVNPIVPRRRFPGIHPPRVIYHPVTGVFVRSRSGVGIVPMHPLDAKGKTPRNLEHGVVSVERTNVVSGPRVIASEPGQKWQTLKSAPKDAFSSALIAATPPNRVSRSLSDSTFAGRGISTSKNSSIVYDAKEHRFVNSNSSANAGAASSREAMQGTASGSLALQGPSSGPNATRSSIAPNASRTGSSTPTRTVNPPAASRAIAPPRAVTPPAAHSSAHSGTGRYDGPSRGASGTSSNAPAPSHASAPAPASHPSAPASGKPH